MTELEEAELTDGQRHRRRQLGWCRPAADEILSMVQLEEDTRNHQLQVEREEQERWQQLEQARIDRLLDETPSLRRAMDIRAYVDVVKTRLASDVAGKIGEYVVQRLKSRISKA